MKTVNKLLNIIMGAFVGVFLGHGIYVFWDYKTNPEIYAMQSAPWYTSILVYGMFTVVILAVGILIKVLLKYCAKKKNEIHNL